jgi:hypothetical protein
MASREDGPPAEIVEYVQRYARELDPADVAAFLDAHPQPDEDTDSPVAWAVRKLRDQGDGEAPEGLGVDRVVDEIRRFDR